MNDLHSLVLVLRRIAALLAANGMEQHAVSFERLADEFVGDPEFTKAKVRRLFAGMGSFNDLILHDDHRNPLQAENDELDRLRHELWELSQNRTDDGG